MVAGKTPDSESVDIGAVDQIASSAALLNRHPERASQVLNGDDRYKVVHFVRHGEGYHNIGFESLEDPHLTANGWSQGANLHRHIGRLTKPLDLQAVFVSPLTRTLETACATFGGAAAERGQPVLMQESIPLEHERTHHLAIGVRPGLPFIAHEGCRERMSLNRCDRRRNLSITSTIFPGVDFSLVKSDDDKMWEQSRAKTLNAHEIGSKYYSPLLGEKEPDVARRGVEFMQWVMDRPEKYVAVVSHREWLKYTLRALTEGGPPELAKELSQSFRNCEMRSVVFNRKGRPMEVLKETRFEGESPRHYLFAVNWTKRAMHGVADHIGNKLGRRHSLRAEKK